MVDVRTLDETAMRIKQSYPSVALFDIRMDLERSRDQQVSAMPDQLTNVSYHLMKILYISATLAISCKCT